MSSSNKYVVQIKQAKITVVKVEAGNKLRIVDGFEYEIESLSQVASVIEDAVEKLGTDRILVVVDDNLCQLIETGVPANTNEEKAFIRQKLEEVSLSKLDDQDWDYEVIEDNGIGQKRVLAFALKNEVKEQLITAAKNKNIWVQLIEPEALARTRDENAILGVCLKKEGKKEAKVPSEAALSTLKAENNKSGLNKIFIGLGLLMLVGGAVWFGIERFGSSNKEDSDLIKANVTPSETIQATATPEISEKPESWQVLNGSGITGLAKTWATDLETLGYSGIKTGNADSADYEETEVKVRKSAFKNQVMKDLQKRGVTESMISTDSSIGYDVEVIIGKDNKSSDP